MKKLFQVALVALMLVPSWGLAQDQDEVLDSFASKMPRGIAGIPNQWVLMKSIVGWEKMMLIFGYADNRSGCEHLVEVALLESPERDFSCTDAN